MAGIVHFGKYYFPDTGGIESVTSSLAEGAARAGHAVTVVCFCTGTFPERDRLNGVTVLRAPITRLISSQPLGWRYLRLCLREARRADLVHFHGPNMLAALCCLLMPQHVGLLVHWHSDVVGKGWLGRIFRPLEQALLRRAGCIIATSPVYAEASASLRPHLDKVSVVPIGVPEPAAGTSAVPLPQQWADRLAGKRLVLSVGRLVPYKGFDLLVAAAAHLPADTLIIIVGGGPLQAELHAAIDAAGMAKRVYLAGRLDATTLDALFRRATLYCMPSRERSEAFGVVLLEAMAYGLPVVATNIPGSGVPWVNQHGVSGLNVPTDDAAALAEACNHILNSANEQARFSTAARQRYLEEFTEAVSVRKTLAIYGVLLNPPAK